MRNSKVIVGSSNLRGSAFGIRHALVIAGILVAVVWVGYAFVQEASIGHRLSQEAADLRHQNTVLAAQNQGYHKDIQALTSGSANEEEARMNGYARPNERIFLITTPPSPSPTPPATPSPTH